MIDQKGLFFNEDCITGCRRHIDDNSIDLIITDPPYGISGDKLHKHYHRKEEFVLDGYIEVPAEEYAKFSQDWIREAERILKPGGSLYVISGYTNLVHILNALQNSALVERNHIIWKYNFGVYTRNKYVSSHYHILYYIKPGGDVTFNTYSRFGQDEKEEQTGSLNYTDREDVWIINREYKPGEKKNKNELPKALLGKIIQYSSNEGDLVCDLFLGSFSTAKVAIGLNRRAIGFEKSKMAFAHQMMGMGQIQQGYLLKELRSPTQTKIVNQGKPWDEAELKRVQERYKELLGEHKQKKKVIEVLCGEFNRGRFSILNVINRMKGEGKRRKKESGDTQLSLFFDKSEKHETNLP